MPFTSAAEAQELFAEAIGAQPHLFVNTGDMVKNGDNIEEWTNMVVASEATWSAVPSLTTVGNHDAGDPDNEGALYNRLFELPREPVRVYAPRRGRR